MGRRPKPKITFDRELTDLPEPMRRREFMMRVEAVIFASSRPVTRETLGVLIACDCNVDQLINDIRNELCSRPYDLVEVAEGFQYRTKRALAEVILASRVVAPPIVELSPVEQLVLTAIAYFQPITRMGVADILGKPVSRDAVAASTGPVDHRDRRFFEMQ
jgi:segregation and condensation protein B